MMKNKNTTILNSRKSNALIIFFSIILLLTFSLEAKESNAQFSAYSNDQITICSCSKQINNIYVSNTGSSTDYYNLQEYLDFVDSAPKNFILKPGETQQIPILINPICGDIGKYELELTITSSTEQKILRQKINVINCKNFDVTINSPSISVCGNLQQNLTILNKEIIDNGKKNQARIFSATGKGIEQRTVQLFPEQSTTLILKPLLYCDASNKASEFMTEYNITNGFFVKTIKNRNLVYTPYKAYELEINPNNLKIDPDDQKAQFTVKNIGKFYSTYDLSIVITDYNETRKSLAWLEQTTVSLKPGEKKEIVLILDSANLKNKYYGEGTYMLEVTGRSIESGINYNKDIKIKLDSGIYEKTKNFFQQYISPNSWTIFLILIILLLLWVLFSVIKWIAKRKQEKLHNDMFEGTEKETAEITNDINPTAYHTIGKIASESRKRHSRKECLFIPASISFSPKAMPFYRSPCQPNPFPA